MDYKREVERRDKRIEDLKKEIKALREEIKAMQELLDCAAANLVLMVNERGKTMKLSKKEVSKALGRFHLQAKDDGNGNYLLEILEE